MRLKSTKYTYLACYMGYIVQALVNNLTPLLFARFNTEFNISSFELSIIPFINFTLQLLLDIFSPILTLKFGARKCALLSHLLSSIGLVLLYFLPYVMNPFAGIILSTIFLAIGGGFIEVILSPIIDSMQTGNKSGAMNILHSFYCFGHVITVVLATLYFKFIGIDIWRWLPLVLVVLPIFNFVLFSICPIGEVKGDDDKSVSYRSIFSMRGFLFLFILIIFSGAAEQSVAQWASYFAEKSLNIGDKAISDMLGICTFALAMAITRLIFGFIGDKIKTEKAIGFSTLLLVASFAIVGFSNNSILTFVGLAICGVFVAILWPSVYGLAAKKYPNIGTRMYGMLAFGGDIGCVLGPTLVGLISADIKVGLAVAMVFPIFAFIAITIFSLLTKDKENKNC